MTNIRDTSYCDIILTCFGFYQKLFGVGQNRNFTKNYFFDINLELKNGSLVAKRICFIFNLITIYDISNNWTELRLREHPSQSFYIQFCKIFLTPMFIGISYLSAGFCRLIMSYTFGNGKYKYNYQKFPTKTKV